MATTAERSAPSDEQRARAERNRQRARALREARATAAPPAPPPPRPAPGGFLPEEAVSAPPRLAPQPPAPAPLASDRPNCTECGRNFAVSYLFDTFEYAACDECRDDEGAHALITRTEAKSSYLLRDCDLDERGTPLRCIRRRNPHAVRGEMRLYLRAQVEERALLVWGSEEALEAELEKRDTARLVARTRKDARRLRALRLEARSALVSRGPRKAHVHEFGVELYDEAADTYNRTCSVCGHIETYEKM